LVGAINKEQI